MANKDELMDQVKAQIALVNAQELISVSIAYLRLFALIYCNNKCVLLF